MDSDLAWVNGKSGTAVDKADANMLTLSSAL